MTSLAFILGVVPLAIAVGAGAEMRSTLGIAVFSGMLGVTLFGIFLTPVFYYLVVRLFGASAPPASTEQTQTPAAPSPKASG
jgi:multidrug efflux pump